MIALFVIGYVAVGIGIGTAFVLFDWWDDQDVGLIILFWPIFLVCLPIIGLCIGLSEAWQWVANRLANR